MGPGGQIATFDGHFLRAYIGNVRGVIGHHTSSQSLYGQHIHQLYPDAVAAIGRAHIHANLPHCLAICTDTVPALFIRYLAITMVLLLLSIVLLKYGDFIRNLI